MLFGRQKLELDDALGFVELEQSVEQRDQQVLVGLGAKDALEDEAGFGVSKNSSQDALMLPEGVALERQAFRHR